MVNMEKKFQFDFNQVGKKTVKNNQRLEQQGEEFLKDHYKKINEEKAAKESKLNEEVLSNARFSQSSIYSKNKQRAQAMKEQIEYHDRASKAGLTNILSTIVEKALLVDEEEYGKLNPNYKTEIKETVLSFLENADLKNSITDKRTLAIMEHISKSVPDVKTGVYLKEEEIVDLISRVTPAEINKSINSLVGDVKDRVTTIVSEEQDDLTAVQNEVDEVVAANEAGKAKRAPAEAQGQPMVDENGQPIDPSQLPPEAMGAEGQPLPPEAGAEGQPEMPVGEDGQPLPPEAGMEGQPMVDENGQPIDPSQLPPEAGQPGMEDPYADDEYLQYQQGQATPGFTAGGQPVQSIEVPQTANKNTAVEVAPDGTVKINIVREKFYREVPKQGILESFAVNEALDMIKEGKPYNGELAIANALMYITIVETFNATGLLNVTNRDYAKMTGAPVRK
jgi:hypothetical protein